MAKNKKNQIQENKDKIVSLRFKPTELEKLDRKCKKVGLTRSAYISRKILSLPVQPARVPSVNWDAYKVLNELLYHLPRIGNNLNQIARILNTAQLEEKYISQAYNPREIENTVEEIKEQLPTIKEAVKTVIGIKPAR